VKRLFMIIKLYLLLMCLMSLTMAVHRPYYSLQLTMVSCFHTL